jgi:hypothetical protein
MALMDIRSNWGDGMSEHGRTKAMVMALPEGGAFVVVHSAVMARYVERMIYDLRGRDFFKRCHVHPVHGHGSLSRLYGLRIPIFVDHAFWMYCPTGLGAAVERIVESANRMRPPIAA